MSDALIEKPLFSSASIYKVSHQIQLLGTDAISTVKPSRLDGLITTVAPCENETAGYASLLWPTTENETWTEEKNRQMISLYPYSTEESKLSTAMWKRDRRIDFTKMKKEIEGKGYTFSEAAQELLGKLSGVSISTKANWMLFDVPQVAGALTKRDISILEKKLQDKICPLAITSSAYVFVGSTGKLFVLDQDWLFVGIAQNFKDLFTSMMVRGPSVLETVTLAVQERPLDLR